MSAEKLDDSLKTRVSQPVKRAFETLAKARHLDVADLSREAFREYLEKHKDQLKVLENGEAKEVSA